MSHSVHPYVSAREWLTSHQTFKKGGLTGPKFLDVGCWEKGGGVFLQGRLQFYIKNKLKSEIFNDKKVYKQKYFSLS